MATQTKRNVVSADGLTYTDVVSTMGVDASGNPVSALPPGRAAATASAPAVLSNEDFAELKRASAGATVSVASSATPVTLLAANTARRGLTVANDSTSILYVLVGAGTVSAALYTYAIPAKATVATTVTIAAYTGIVTGLWATANGAALVTELT